MGLFDIFGINKNKDVIIDKKNKIIINKKQGYKIQVDVHAEEGSHTDITSTSITGITTVEATQKKNQYKTYASIVNGIYDMFNSCKDYGGEFIKSVIRTRVAFIAGGGITVIAEKEETANWINGFLKYNKLLEGSNLFRAVTISEMEGKCLLIIKKNKDKNNIDVRYFPFNQYNYQVTMEDKDDQVIKSVTYKPENSDKTEDIAKLNKLVFVKIGGSPDRINETVPVIGNCLTDIENASRIKYDLRYNNHLFGRLTPVFKTKDMTEAKALNNLLIITNWKIGKAYCGTADFKLVGPPPEATEALLKELVSSNRIISMNTGIPVHWLSYPDLMSNRACYSEDTKTLTENGWKYYWEIDENEKIACFNPENKCIEYQTHNRLFVYDYEGEMIHFKNSRMDILVTPDHKMWSLLGEKKKNRKQYIKPFWQKIEAQELKERFWITFRDYCNYKANNNIEMFFVEEHDSSRDFDKQPTGFYAKDFYEFLGYYLSEGGCGEYKTSSHTNKPFHKIVHLAQNEGTKADKIRNILNKMKLKYNETKDKNNCIRWHIHHSGLVDYLKNTFGDNHLNKNIPYKFRDVSIELLKILFNALMLGDGSYDKRKNRTSGFYCSSSLQLIENVQDIMLKLGYTTSLQTNNKITKKGVLSICHRVNFCEGKIKKIKGYQIKNKKYKGKVYCFSTNTGLFFTMRNNKVAIQGNTAENLMEVVNSATILEREIWEESIIELIQKAMTYAVELGIPGAVNDPDGFDIKLPLISEAKLKEIQEVWIPLADGGYITKDSVRNKIPGINPLYEKRMIENEKEAELEKVKNKFGNEFDTHDHENEEMINEEELGEGEEVDV